MGIVGLRRWCPQTVQVTHGHRLGCKKKKTCLQATGHLSDHDPPPCCEGAVGAFFTGIWRGGGQSAVVQEARGHLVETETVHSWLG